jgi:hypothetical protein
MATASVWSWDVSGFDPHGVSICDTVEADCRQLD